MKTTWFGLCPKCKRQFTFEGKDNKYECQYCDTEFTTETTTIAKPIIFKPRNVKDIPIEEKIKKFDELYESALDHYNETIKGESTDDDLPHYMFESVMGLLGNDEMWKSYNNASD